jgi:hypothetical protein
MVECFQEGSLEQHKMVLLLIFHRAWLKIYLIYRAEMIRFPSFMIHDPE